ncbi:MAG: DUF885 domain-containing protein [Acidimicrobiales bacterium]|nr:MAG: DUF885 domain-containing protein [Acidimicrobiales bacterium]
MRKLLLVGVSTFILAGCSPSEAPVKETNAGTETSASTTAVQNENERIDAWFEERFQAGIAKYPQFMTQLGMKKDYDKWNNQSKSFYLEGLEETRTDLEYLKANFDYDKLDESRKISYRLFEKNAKQDLEGADWWGYGYNFNQMFGAQSRIPSFLINYHRIDSVEDANAYIARINGVKDYLGQIVENSKDSAARGIQPPLFVYDYVINDANNVLQGAPFTEDGTSTLMADFEKKISDGKLGFSDEEKAGLMEKASDALLTSFKPAYENMIAEMEAQKSTATTDDGAWKLPKGEEFYKRRLRMMTTTDMTASEIHDLGLAEVARIHGEMRDIMKKVGFEGNLQDFFKHLKEDPAQTYEDSDAGREAYLADATEMIDIMKGRLDEVFLRKPKADLEVKRVEAFREKSAGKAFYNRPAPDGSRPGRYYANLYRISDMPKYQMEALAYHEGIPGHHMQLAIAQELDGIPKFRKFGGYTAYTEGWGLYSEFLPKEMGFYSDPYSDFGRLAMEIWRAARLVVDTGLHDKKWTREQAIDYLLANTPNPKGDVVKAIERYIVMPGQATAYKIGMLKIQSLREDAKTRLGDKFDIREFHDVVLAEGAVPLDILEERVDAWVNSKA